MRASLSEEDLAKLARLDPSILEAYGDYLACMDEERWEAHRETMERIQEADRVAKPLAAELVEGVWFPPELVERLKAMAPPGAVWDQLRKALHWKGLRLTDQGGGWHRVEDRRKPSPPL